MLGRIPPHNTPVLDADSPSLFTKAWWLFLQSLGAAKAAIVASSLAASLPVKTDASSLLVTGAIDLSGTEATGVLAAARFPALTGDITTSAGALATTLKNTGPGAGTYTVGAKLTVPGVPGTITIDSKGRITAIQQAT